MNTEKTNDRISKHRFFSNLSARNCFSIQLRLFLIYFFLISLSEALAQCRVEQRSHTLEQLNDADVTTFANQTDLRAIYRLLGPILVERVVGTSAHREVGDYLERTLRTYGFNTEWDSFKAFTTPKHGNLNFRNLIATFNPEIPRRLVLACHYDSKFFENFVFKAATDSALPCALLLDLARTLSLVLNKRKNKDVTLQLVFFDGEEAFGEWSDKDSIYGARHLASKWNNRLCFNVDRSDLSVEKELFQVEVLVLLDLLGTRYPYPQIQSTYGHGTENLFERLVETEDQLRRMSKLRKIPQTFRRGVRYAAVEDDHLPFLSRGVPVVHLIPVPFPVVWHAPTDDERALDDDVIFNLATIIRVFVARYLGVRPAYINDYTEK